MDYSERHDNYFWTETPWADIELHTNKEGECWLRIKSFNPERSREYIRSHRRKHDQIINLDLTPIDPWTMKAKYDLTLKLSSDGQTAGFLIVPGIARLDHWNDTHKFGETFVTSTYLNQCDYYADGKTHEVADPYEEIIAQEEFSTTGQIARILREMGS
ncbi:hypothetical protein [Bosea sp. TAF32]|uniref:hypothetical protein n=1 Tax=Bosea sp. TAF32 TaxID=3237482 RepID=UPI003F8EAB86